jgi:hypothetical protein
MISFYAETPSGPLVENASPKTVFDPVVRFIQSCSWIFLRVLTRPWSFGSDDSPGPDEAALFVTTAAFAVATLLRITQSLVPPIIAWNEGNSTVLIATLRQWSELQAGDKAYATLALWATFTSMLVLLGALAMTISLMVFQLRWFGRTEFGETFRRSCILVSTALIVIVGSEALFPLAAQSAMPGWIVAVLFVICVPFIPLYAFWVVPYIVWRAAFRRGRAVTLAAVLLSWPLALLLASPLQFGYFAPEDRIDSVLSAQLQNVIRLSKEKKYKEAVEETKRSSSLYEDSIQLDSLMLSTRLRAFNRAVSWSSTFGPLPAEDDRDWALDVKARYNDLSHATEQFQHKYSDVPGMLLKVARAQRESGQCDRAQVLFEAVYQHRHAMLVERIFAGLYLRAMDRPPDDFVQLLARFGPTDDWKFMRAELASPGIGLGMFQEDFKELSDRLTDLHAYADDLLDNPPKQRCYFVSENR